MEPTQHLLPPPMLNYSDDIPCCVLHHGRISKFNLRPRPSQENLLQRCDDDQTIAAAIDIVDEELQPISLFSVPFFAPIQQDDCLLTPKDIVRLPVTMPSRIIWNPKPRMAKPTIVSHGSFTEELAGIPPIPNLSSFRGSSRTTPR